MSFCSGHRSHGRAGFQEQSSQLFKYLSFSEGEDRRGSIDFDDLGVISDANRREFSGLTIGRQITME